MASKNAERLEQYKTKMRAAGFKRLSVWVCPELAAMLAAKRQPHECGGRTLERLLLGEARKRPQYWADGERSARTRAAATTVKQTGKNGDVPRAHEGGISGAVRTRT
ncbi:hypothetical protein MAFF301560_23190 [Ralstonia solanacearum]|nr:hypothetical protein MAFF301560_23190 [Ralstonia solanacearum]BEU46316.1 hypothetical protein MAFF211519_16410 [Ralstonia pseudosolanacearum]